MPRNYEPDVCCAFKPRKCLECRDEMRLARKRLYIDIGGTRGRHRRYGTRFLEPLELNSQARTPGKWPYDLSGSDVYGSSESEPNGYTRTSGGGRNEKRKRARKVIRCVEAWEDGSGTTDVRVIGNEHRGAEDYLTSFSMQKIDTRSLGIVK